MNLPHAPCATSTLSRPDGTTLTVHHWPAQNAPTRGHVLVLHGYLEHSKRYAELAHHLAQEGFDTWGYDMRGHGLSTGQRGFVCAFNDYIDDAEAVFATLPTDAPRFALGHSHGGLVALDWVNTRKPQLAGLVLTNPYLSLATPVPFPKRLAGKVASKVLPWLSLPAGLTSEQMSHDPQMIEAHRSDGLIYGKANARWFVEATKAQERVQAESRLPVPVLFVYSDGDPIANPALNRAFADRLQSPDKQVTLRPGEFHEVLNETHRQTLFAQIAKWLTAHSKGAP